MLQSTSKEKVHKILSDFGLDKIKKIILRSEKENKEYGFDFCENKKITSTDICIGTKCSIKKPGCKENEKNIGSFHTHPKSESKIGGGNPSDNDLFVSYEKKRDFTCIGVTEKNTQRVKCYLYDFGIGSEYIKNLTRYKENYENKLKKYLPEIKDVNLYNIVSKVNNSKLNIYQQMEILDIVNDYVELLKEGTKNAQIKIHMNKSSDLEINLK